MKRLLMTVLAATGVAGLFAAELPALCGDGVHDDTAAIQARLDTGASCVYLPPPTKEYLISKTLLLSSGQELRLDRFTRVRLAPGSSCYMLSNRNRDTGDRRIALTGGIWDFDNVSQAPNPQQAHRCKPPVKVVMPPCHDPKFFWGTLMSFKCVNDLQIRHVTFRNPCSYSCQLAGVSNFRVDDVTFDFDKWNPIRLNMDGIHLDGDCHHGRITDLNGTCFDDLVAINANDGQCSPKEAPITDIEVDGIHAEYCHSAVRILSAGAEIRRVTIRNVFGHFYTYVVGFTHFFPKKPRGAFDDITVENVFASKALSPEDIGVMSRANMPPIWFQGPIDCGTILLRNISRDERTLPVATIGIDPKATIRHLTVRDCKMVNRLDKPIDFVTNADRVERLVLENNDFISAPGAWRNTGNKENDKMEEKAFVWNKIGECDQYQGMHPLFKKAFEFLKRPDLATLEVGRYEIEKDNCWAMVQSCELTPFGEIQHPELHGAFIDIQAPLDGPETYGLYDTKGRFFGPFDAAKDVCFADMKTEPLTLQPGEFAIFFPVSGAHAPCKTLGPKVTRKKLVIKIRK